MLGAVAGPLGRFSAGYGFEVVDAAVSHQRQKKMTVLDHVRAHELPVPGDTIVERARRTRRARKRKRTELEVIRSRRLPRSRAAVAVDSRAHATIGAKENCVLRLVIGCQRLLVAALEFHELPGRAAESGGWIRRSGLLARTTGDNEQDRRQRQRA